MDAGSETDDETSDDALEKPSFMTRLTGAPRADAPADMAKQETAAIADRRPNISGTLSKRKTSMWTAPSRPTCTYIDQLA